MQAVRLVNAEGSQWGALAQEGKYLRKGETYRFQGLLRSEGETIGAEIRFYLRGRWEHPIAVLPLPGIGRDYVQKSATFRNTDFEGYATFSLWIPAGASGVADDFSLLPASAFPGWREDVIGTIQQLRPGLFRFPGGCFASLYDWRNGVGPLSRRKPDASYFWGGMNYNDLGTDEFAAMCERVGAEMMLAVNLPHPAKRDYLRSVLNKPPENSTHSFDMSRFTELEQGAREAAAWVAYCNLPAGKHAIADLRAANGFRRGGDIAWVNFNNLANTHAQSAVETPKESAFLAACAVAMSAIARSPAAWPLHIAGYEARVAGDLQVQAASAEARNTAEDPDAVRRQAIAARVSVRKECRITAAPWSFTEIILE
jgi:alpha-L-arabinofuranosidase